MSSQVNLVPFILKILPNKPQSLTIFGNISLYLGQSIVFGDKVQFSKYKIPLFVQRPSELQSDWTGSLSRAPFKFKTP